MSGPNPFRQDPETCCIGRETGAERRRRARLQAVRAHRPHDQPEREALQAAVRRYAEVHGPQEAFGVLSLETARYAPDVPAPRRAARAQAERMFEREGEAS